MRKRKLVVRSERQRKSAIELAHKLARRKDGTYIAQFPWVSVISFLLGVSCTLLAWYLGYRMGLIDYFYETL